MSEWLPVPGYEGLYIVSDKGEIASVFRQGKPREPRLLKPCVVKSGHLMVSLYKDGKGRSHLLHRLIMLAFVGPCPDGHEVCHDDSTPGNNRLINLRYDTRAGNEADKVKNGTSNRGSRNGRTVLTESQAAKVKEMISLGNDTIAEISRVTGVAYDNVKAIRQGRAWKYL